MSGFSCERPDELRLLSSETGDETGDGYLVQQAELIRIMKLSQTSSVKSPDRPRTQASRWSRCWRPNRANRHERTFSTICFLRKSRVSNSMHRSRSCKG